MSTPVISGGRLYATDSMRTLHCLDARTGGALWTHEVDGEVWASALVADGKVYLGTRRGEFSVLADASEKTLLFRANLGAPISATATAANGTVYVATMTTLHALRARP
jgi:outer membrane protein assembly factor BamB